MTYNEWRDELKSNLLSVSESERRRVLDYYAEAYADRRDAGYSEREIIEDFGAPYDAAQRILSDGADASSDFRDDDFYDRKETREERRKREERERREERELREERKREERRDESEKKTCKERKNNDGDCSWVFVILCIVFAIPIFALVMAMVGITIGLCVAPFATLVYGVSVMGAGIGQMFADPALGALTLGGGIVIWGVSVILISVFTKIVKLMWKLFTSFFSWLKGLFGRKEKSV